MSHLHYVVSCKLGQTWKLCKLPRGRLGTLKCELIRERVNKTGNERKHTANILWVSRRKYTQGLDRCFSCHMLFSAKDFEAQSKNELFTLTLICLCLAVSPFPALSLSLPLCPLTLLFLTCLLPPPSLCRSHLSWRTWGQFLRIPAEGVAHVRQDGYRSSEDIWWRHRGTIWTRFDHLTCNTLIHFSPGKIQKDYIDPSGGNETFTFS